LSSVVYIALGAYRVRAAREHAIGLAERGDRVDLVVADLPAWRDVDLPLGVTVHRLGAADPRRTIREARKLVLRKDGPVVGADLLVAGDPLAMPAALAATGPRPDLDLRLEPADDYDRRTAAADLAVVTPWYPSPNNPFAGAFVEAAIDAVRDAGRRVSILHTEDWTPAPAALTDLTTLTADRLVARSGRGIVLDTPLGELTRVPVLIDRNRDYATWAYQHVNALRAALPTGMIEAPLVHAHTGIYGGVLAANLAHPEARIVVTEHAGFLQRVFGQPESRYLYEDVLDRIDVMLCVTEHLREQIAVQFPRYADKLRVAANVVDFDRFPAGAAPVDLLRWLYVGRLIDQKRVDVLLEAFAIVAREEPRATLTLVGHGTLEDKLRARAAGLGLAGRVTIRPPVLPDEVAGVMHEHDLLVHASPAETFGLTLVEAVAAGRPVLAARSEGPAETLSGLEDAAGGLVDVSTDPEVIAAGWRELRARRASLDLPAARAALLGRYGREAVAAKLRAAYAPTSAPAQPATPPAPAAPPGEAEHVLLLAINPPSYRRATEFANKLVQHGVVLDVVTSEARHWHRQKVDPRVRLHLVAQREQNVLPTRITDAVFEEAPGRALRRLRAASRRRHTLWPEIAVMRAQKAHGKGSRAIREKLYGPVYRVVRPLALWRIFRKQVAPQLDLGRVRRIVVYGSSAVAIGWRLARADPTLEVTVDVDAARFVETSGRPVVAGR
jgi:glycogen(starch) synthase